MNEQMGNRFFDGMAIIVKYEPGAELAANHDIIWFGVYRPELMTEEERETMKRLRWFENDDAWAHYC